MAKKEKDNGWDWSWHGGRKQGWVPGVVLILIGTVFLARNYYGLELNNWWALFILFPAVSSFARAFGSYQGKGRLEREAGRHAFWGFFFVMLSATFLFGLEFSLIWPVFLIIGGLAMLVGAL